VTKPVGVLGLQGDFREHLQAFDRLGIPSLIVKRPSELSEVSGLVIPGGESTTIGKLARIFEIFDPIKTDV
jgi:5'-phosphate synthase pdxT subunit